ncbi:MAG: hypothetical protein R3C28_29695 [Pirellulaceae bacterium]
MLNWITRRFAGEWDSSPHIHYEERFKQTGFVTSATTGKIQENGIRHLIHYEERFKEMGFVTSTTTGKDSGKRDSSPLPLRGTLQANGIRHLNDDR